MATKVTRSGRKQISLLSKFHRSIILIYVLSVLGSIPVVYYFTSQQADQNAHKELSLIVDMIGSIRDYVSKDLRPGLLEAELYHSPGMSGTVTTGLVAGHFKSRQQDYYIKISSDNPLNIRNMPEPLERTLLKRFRADDGLKVIQETGKIHGKELLVSAKPSIAKMACLRCHGDAVRAPNAIKSKYGVDSGYSYKVGDVVGMTVVGVPLDDVNALVIKRVLFAVLALTIVFAVIVLLINALVKKSIISPVVNITQMAAALSKGDLEHEIDQQQGSKEISELASAIERMRRSMAAAMKRIQG